MIDFIYTTLPNHLIDETIKGKNLTAFDKITLIYIVRKTLGFHKLTDAISISCLCKETELCRMTVVKSLKNLEKNKFIFIDKQSTQTNKITINQEMFKVNHPKKEDILICKSKKLIEDKEIITSISDIPALVHPVYQASTSDIPTLVHPVYQFPESLKKEKEIYKETTTKKDAQARVVVFSSLEKYEFSEQYKLKICSEYSEKQIDLALKRLDRMQNKKNLEACMMACLKNEESWVDKMSESEIEEKNFEFLQTLKHLDRKNILSVDIAVGKFYIEFSGGQSIKTFDVKDENFIDNVQDMLNKMKISPLKSPKIEQIDASNTKVPTKNLASK